MDEDGAEVADTEPVPDSIECGIWLAVTPLHLVEQMAYRYEYDRMRELVASKVTAFD